MAPHRGDEMALKFPNGSRSFDETRRGVRFWGYDSVVEHQFVIAEEALKRLSPGVSSDEAGLLQAFDANLGLIQKAAVKVYGQGRKGSYDLAAGDF
jgi:hypothetical protein